MSERFRLALERQTQNKRSLAMLHSGTESTTCTGTLTYRNVEFTFVFDGEELRLIPPKDKAEEIFRQWILTPLKPQEGQTCGRFDPANPLLTIEEPLLTGKCNEDYRVFLFLTRRGERLRFSRSVLFVRVAAYFEFDSGESKIARIDFRAPEIDRVYPSNRAVHEEFDENDFSKGVWTLKTRPLAETITEKQTFQVDGVDAQAGFYVARRRSSALGESPLTLNSVLTFNFEPTADRAFIFRLWGVAKRFLQFLNYRRNVYLPEAKLYATGGLNVGVFRVLDETGDAEKYAIRNEMCVKQSHIAGAEGKILTELAANTLYTRHIPETFRSGRQIDVARFLLITTAFEWEFTRFIAELANKKKETDEIDETEEPLVAIFDREKRKQKVCLSEKIEKCGDRFDAIVGDYGRVLYSLNGETFELSDAARRLARQRNAYAHGNLEREFDHKSSLALIYLLHLVYAIQLRRHGVNDANVKKAINDLFDWGMDGV